MGSTVLVTGASGFLGRRVVRGLADRGHEPVGFVRSSAAADVVRSAGGGVVVGDLDDPATLDRAHAEVGPDQIVHVASLGFGHAEAMVQAAEGAGVARTVFVSTTAVLTRLDAGSKSVRLAAEATIAASSLDWLVLRPSMIYGAPGDRNMERLLRYLARGGVVPMPGGGRGLQQPVHVDDLAAAVVATLDLVLLDHRIVTLAGPEALPLREVVAEAAWALGRRPRAVPVPAATVASVLRRLERVVRLPLRAEQVERVVEDKQFAIDEARALLGFDPRSFADGIRGEAVALGLA
ncbi:MAG: NAD-dependent epimerase/dehydratase [Actinomycetia bacterium]|nr:NAD-dependent epimerase/dehydratase [Actinomycetes bacterium]